MLSTMHSFRGGGGSLERKHKGCWWWQRLLVWHRCWGDLSAEEWICTRRKTVRGVIKGCRYNQPQSSALASHTVWACNSPFITHLPLCLQRHGDPGRNSKPQRSHSIRPELFGCNQAAAVLPWKPWRNLEPSGSSSGVYSLYPPTKSWLKTLRPTRGPGDEPVLLRCPSTFRKMWNVIIKALKYVGVSVGAPLIWTSAHVDNAQPWIDHRVIQAASTY